MRGSALFTVLTVLVVGVAGCSLSTTSSNPNTSSLPPSSNSGASSGGSGNSGGVSANAPEPGPFHGNGDENIGTITVPPNTVLKWTCGSCGSANFIVGNSVNDSGTIDVNALNQTSGQTEVDGGTYHDVMVNTEGNNWTITFEHQ